MNEYLRINYKYHCFNEARFWMMVSALLLSGALTLFILYSVLVFEGLKILSTILALVAIAPILFAIYYVIMVKINEKRNP